MTLTTAECIDWLDKNVIAFNGQAGVPDLEGQIAITIRDKLLAAEELAKAVDDWAKVSDDLETFDGDKRGILHSLEITEVALGKALYLWRKAGAQ